MDEDMDKQQFKEIETWHRLTANSCEADFLYFAQTR